MDEGVRVLLEVKLASPGVRDEPVVNKAVEAVVEIPSDGKLDSSGDLIDAELLELVKENDELC